MERINHEQLKMAYFVRVKQPLMDVCLFVLSSVCLFCLFVVAVFCYFVFRGNHIRP